MSIPVFTAAQGELIMLQSLAVSPFIPTPGGSTISMHLYQNNFSPGPGTVYADFVEATYTGYLGQNTTGWDGPFIDPETGRPFLVTHDPWIFSVGAGPVTPNTIYGWYLYVRTKGVILAERFDSPIEMDAPGKTITLFNKVFATGVDSPTAVED